METKQKRRKVVVSLLALAGLVVFSLQAIGSGSLEPSAPPGPIMKTLDEVEPRIPIQSLSGDSTCQYLITQSGSYYLTGDVTVVSTTKHGIIVECNDVTIDLMGYTLKGPDSGTGNGIYMSGQTNVEIRNGTVRDFFRGIYENSGSGRGHRVINVRVVSNSTFGIFLNGSSHLVKDCTAVENGGYGIYAGNGCTVTGNTACDNNGSYGIYAGSGSTVTGNTANDNGGHGIGASSGSTVTGNTAYSNGSIGITVGNGCTVTGNTALNNGSNGINAGSGSTVTGNTAYYNQNYGIWLGGNCLVDGNTAVGNNQSGGGYTNIIVCGSCTFGLNHAP
jgi:parallel beta-helix repeat protein